MQSEGRDKLYSPVEGLVSKSVMANKNRAKTWLYGYNDKDEIVINSKTGKVGDIFKINGINISLPPALRYISDVHNRWVRK